MHSTMKVAQSNRSRRSLFLVLLMATLTTVVHGQPNATNATVVPTPTAVTPTTIAPTITPPVEAPTTAPIATEEPSVRPVSEPPVSEPPVSDPPVATAPPTMGETDEPTIAPIVATERPTTAPVPETDAPTVATKAPTTSPTVAPTDAPTFEPAIGTDAPTESPPTMAPTVGTQPTPTPASVPQKASKFQSLEMIMTGVDPLDVDSFQIWSEELIDWYTSYYEEESQFGISNVSSIVNFVSQDPPSQRRGLSESRNLQSQELTVVYDQTITYQSSDPDFSSSDVIMQAFASDNSRAQFTAKLKATGIDAFADITGVSAVSQQGESNSSTLSTGAIIGIAVGGAAGLVLLGGAGYWATHRGDSGYEKTIGDHPPSSLQLGGGDDVSTLNDPSKGLRAADSVGGYGDQSVATVDYDYSKAYGGGADSSVVSSVGGTLGSQTQATAAGAGTVEGSYSEDFDVAYQDPNTTVKEIALEVWAPPGKLGVVIDTPNDGAPVVHAIKDSSVIADKLQVGDKLLAVDDENVEAMTAIKVSKLISRKSANPTRKLSILRQVVE